MNAAAKRRVGLLDQYFAGWKTEMWHKDGEVGYVHVPRTLSLICALLKLLVKNTDSSRVYLDLWCRIYPEAHLIEVKDAREFAYASCLRGRRAVQSWQERIDELERLGFIKTATRFGERRYYIFLRHPDLVVQELMRRERVPDLWLQEYEKRLSDIRAKRWRGIKKKEAKASIHSRQVIIQALSPSKN